LATKGEAMIIAFAGTDPLNLLNWLSDFYLGRLSAGAHQNFAEATAAVWTEVGTAYRTMHE